MKMLSVLILALAVVGSDAGVYGQTKPAPASRRTPCRPCGRS